MSHSPRCRCAPYAWLALALGLGAGSANAAPPIQVGTPEPLDRLGTVPGSPGILAVGNGAGEFAVAWHATVSLVQARVYDQAGYPLTPVIEVTRQAQSGTQLGLDLDPAGNLLVGWFRQYDPASRLGTLVARRFDAEGTPVGAETVVSTSVYGTGLYTDFLVKLAADGSSMVVWQQGTSPFTKLTLVARVFAPDGRPKGPDSVVSDTDLVFFPNIALAFEGDKALVAYGRGRKSGDQFVSDLWVRWLDDAGALSSNEIALPLPPPTFGGYEPIGARLLPGGRFALTYQRCDPVTFDNLCSAAGMLEADATGAVLSFREVIAPPNGFGSDASWMATDGLGNLSIVVLNRSLYRTDFAAMNPLGRTAAQAVLPPSAFPEGASPAGLVGLGPSLFGLAWYQDDWTYFQAIAVGSEVTPAPSFYTVEPCRLIDTRIGGPALAAGEDRAVPAAGMCSIPTGARAVAANVVSVESTAVGDIRFYRPDRLVPATSALNYGAGQVRANSAVIALDDAGALAVRATQPLGTTHLIIDVSGYFQ